MKIIAHIYNDFPTKFGLPRQSGLCEYESKIVFTKPYRVSEALRGLDDYSHIWLLWKFSRNEKTEWTPTVRPPRLGGNKRMGVFATRSPFRPNPIGLSCVRLVRIEKDGKLGEILIVSGADLANETPIYDIKPYLPFADSVSDAKGGFADLKKDYHLKVEFKEGVAEKIAPKHLKVLNDILSQDPRPSYHNDPNRIYGFSYADMEIKFTVRDDILTVCDIICSR